MLPLNINSATDTSSNSQQQVLHSPPSSVTIVTGVAAAAVLVAVPNSGLANNALIKKKDMQISHVKSDLDLNKKTGDTKGAMKLAAAKIAATAVIMPRTMPTIITLASGVTKTPRELANQHVTMQTVDSLLQGLKEDSSKSQLAYGFAVQKMILFLTGLMEKKEGLLAIYKFMKLIPQNGTLEDLDTFLTENPNAHSLLTTGLVALEQESHYSFEECGSALGANSKIAILSLYKIAQAHIDLFKIKHLQKPDEVNPWLASQILDPAIKERVKNQPCFQEITDEINVMHVFSFNMNWVNQFFHPGSTENSFITSAGSLLKAQFMTAYKQMDLYFGDDFILLEIPHAKIHNGNIQYRTFCLSSADPTKIESLVKKLGTDILPNWISINAKFVKEHVKLVMPTLKISKELDLRASLEKRGVPLKMAPIPLTKFSQKFDGELNQDGYRMTVQTFMCFSKGGNFERPTYYPIVLDRPWILFTVAENSTTHIPTLLPTAVINDEEFLRGQNTLSSSSYKMNESTLLINAPMDFELASPQAGWKVLQDTLPERLKNTKPKHIKEVVVGRVTLKILNYTDHQIDFDYHRTLLINGKKCVSKVINKDVLEFVFYSEESCNILVYEENGNLCLRDKDVGVPPNAKVHIYNPKTAERIGVQPDPYNSTSFVSSAAGSLEPADSTSRYKMNEPMLLINAAMDFELASPQAGWKVLQDTLPERLKNTKPKHIKGVVVGWVTLKILNYTDHQIDFDYQRTLLINGKKCFVKDKNKDVSEFVFYSEASCNILVYEENGNLCLRDKDVGLPPGATVHIYNPKTAEHIDMQSNPYNSTSFVSSAAGSSEPADSTKCVVPLLVSSVAPPSKLSPAKRDVVPTSSNKTSVVRTSELTATGASGSVDSAAGELLSHLVSFAAPSQAHHAKEGSGKVKEVKKTWTGALIKIELETDPTWKHFSTLGISDKPVELLLFNMGDGKEIKVLNCSKHSLQFIDPKTWVINGQKAYKEMSSLCVYKDISRHMIMFEEDNLLIIYYLDKGSDKWKCHQFNPKTGKNYTATLDYPLAFVDC